MRPPSVTAARSREVREIRVPGVGPVGTALFLGVATHRVALRDRRHGVGLAFDLQETDRRCELLGRVRGERVAVDRGDALLTDLLLDLPEVRHAAEPEEHGALGLAERLDCGEPG